MKHNFTNKQTVYCGDIHGEFRQLIYELDRFKIKDSLIICLGDIGLGFNKRNYYFSEFNKMQIKLKKNNNNLLMFRGNHDDPDYFNSELNSDFNNKYANIILASDYDTIKQNNITSLIVGGAISIDRTLRTLNKTYWDDEVIHFNDDDFKKIKNEKDISIILTHSSPSNKWPLSKNNISYYTSMDKNLSDDDDYNRSLLSNVYDALIKNGCNITNWYYGHYHEDHVEYINNVEYRCVDKNKFYISYDDEDLW